MHDLGGSQALHQCAMLYPLLFFLTLYPSHTTRSPHVEDKECNQKVVLRLQILLGFSVYDKLTLYY